MHTSEHPAHRPHAILVLGGTGFVGSHLCRALTSAGHQVSIASRQPHRHTALSRIPGLKLLELNNNLQELAEGHDVLVNLVGILNEPRHDGRTFEKVHVDLTRDALRAAHAAGIRRYLHMSALGADATAGSSFYQRSKGKAEDLAHAFGHKHGINVTSFRPSVIFGPGDAFLNRFAQLARWVPLVFPLACPQARFSPVYVGDVVNCMADSIDDPATFDQRLNLCGPRDYTLEDIVSYAASVSGHPRKVIGLPDWMARLQATVLENVPGKPFTRDNYDSLQVPNVCPEGCPRQPTALETVAQNYLASGSRG